MNFKNINLFVILFISFFYSCTDSKKKVSVIKQKDSLFTFHVSGQRLIVDAHGGRIISFKMDTVEMIGPGGSTFWVSPQRYWSWPPVKQHHQEIYTSKINGDTLILKSKKDDLLHVEIIKIIYPNSIDTSFTIRYGILNSSDSILDIAPWENTRVFKSSILFYPRGITDSMASNPVFGKLDLVNEKGINWFAFDTGRVQGKNMGKVFADGSGGWISAANKSLVLIKKFEDILPAQQAPTEGEIEIFSDLENPFLEMEEQGPYTRLKPGDILWWEVKWLLRKIPEGIEVKEANDDLINFVKNTVN